MKKILCMLLTLCITISVFSISAYALTTSDIKSSYDYNSDGKVNLYDARAILKVSAGIEAPVEGKLYDLDGDGFVTFYDVKAVLSVAVGIDTEIDVAASQEYLLSLFTDELNRVKQEKPGFKKNTIQTTESAVLTYYLAGQLGGMEMSELAELSKDEEMMASISEIYKPIESERNINRRSDKHKTLFLINTGTEEACLLTVDDIASIRCYEQDGYIYREVTLNEEKYASSEYPSNSKDRMETISYAKIFSVPQLNSANTELNEVTFKDGKITVKVDKYTGVPVNVETEYRCIADLNLIVDEDEKNSGGLGISVKIKGMTMTTLISESYTINPVEVK